MYLPWLWRAAGRQDVYIVNRQLSRSLVTQQVAGRWSLRFWHCESAFKKITNGCAPHLATMSTSAIRYHTCQLSRNSRDYPEFFHSLPKSRKIGCTQSFCTHIRTCLSQESVKLRTCAVLKRMYRLRTRSG